MKKLLSHIHKTFTTPGSKVKVVEDIDVYEERPATLWDKIRIGTTILLVVVGLIVAGVKIYKHFNRFPKARPVSAVYYID